MKKIVIALGGNALQEAGKPATAEAQLEVVEKTSEYIADIIGEGYKVIIAHGNGPQVGRIVLQNEYATPVSPAMPFDVCGAMSQGYIGYHIQQGLTKVLRSRGNKSEVATVVTQVLVDRNDPKFKNPSKPIGPFYTEEEAKKIADEKGYVMKEDAGRGWRRVVASPMPVEIEELSAVKCLVDNGFVVITVGGGGIPVIRNDKGELEGTAAVIDKDLASEKLAEDLDADALALVQDGTHMFNFSNLRMTETVEESKGLNEDGIPKVIISASGMCDAGRIRHHLKHNLWKPECTIVFVGYQGEGTLGRSLLEGVRSVKLFGEEIAVHAKIVNFQGLSSHADRDHLLAWIADIKAPKPQHVFIVHGDREVAPYFAESVEKLGFTAHAPQYTEVYDLLEDQIVAPGYLPERKAKAVGGQRVSSAYERLVALGQRMVDVIRRSKGRDNKTLGRWADQLRQLLDKWEES